MYKAAEYFKILLIKVGVDKEGRMKVDEVKKKINKNTILICRISDKSVTLRLIEECNNSVSC